MIKNLSFLLVIFTAIACQNQSAPQANDDVALSGTIANFKGDYLYVINKYSKVQDSIAVDSSGIFDSRIKVNEGYYRIIAEQESHQIYLRPGFNLSMNIDYQQYDETLAYEGTGAEPNNYLAKKYLLEEGFGQLNYYGYYAKLDENDFLDLADSLHQLNVSLLDSSDIADDRFQLLETNSLNYGLLDKKSNYEGMHQFVTGKQKFKVSDDYPDVYKDFNPNQGDLLIAPGYYFAVSGYAQKKASEAYKDGIDYVLLHVKTVDSLITAANIKRELLYNIGKYRLDGTKELDQVFEIISTNLSDLSDKDRLGEVSKVYEAISKLAKGKPSPDFNFADMEGTEMTLADFRGYIVYIDIWATWCLPCIKEFPDTKQLMQKFEGQKVKFVGISQDRNKASWEKMVKEESLGGTQLIADREDQFFTDYQVSGIPRYILLDTEGNILDANAKRPSNPNLEAELTGLLSTLQ